MKKLLVLLVLPLIFVSFFPVSASAETEAGIKPSSFFYFFDTTFEKVGLFFTFNTEKKARKALEYANERLAEAKESANENKPKAVEKAMEGYKKEISFATEKSKELKDEKKSELLKTVSESTAKHQEILENILDKVPDEAKDAILKAIEVSKKGQEEALREIATLKKEVVELKDEIQELKEELKNKDTTQEAGNDNEKIEQLKREIEELKQEVKRTRLQESKAEEKQAVSETKEDEIKIITLPSGAVIEVDKNGNITKTLKEAPQQIYTSPKTTTQNQMTKTGTEEVKITSVNIVPNITSAKIEWETNKPTEAKVFLSGGNLSSKVYQSESGLSTRHFVSVGDLKGGIIYSYEIEAIANGKAYKKTGDFSTKNPPPPTFSISKEPVLPTSSWPGWNYFKINSQNGNFVFEALTLEVSNPDEKIGSKTKVGEVQWRTLDKQGWNYRTCDAINSAFMSWQNKSYPYPCPTSSNPLYLTYANPDWQGNEVNLTINPSITFPPGVEIYYYKVTDTNTGKVFEYQK